MADDEGDEGLEDLERLYGQAGVRASVPLWKVNPHVRSRLWNLNGLAHKIVFDADYSVAASNHTLGELPLYDPLDDDAIEAFRRQLPLAPPISQTDERYYALRSGMGGWVTSPVTEIAADMTALRCGMRNRWQTKLHN